MIENAVVAADGRTVAEGRAEVAGLWARFNQVARTNPLAAFPKALDAAAIDTPSPDNRPLAFPYNKWHASQWTVDQAAALVFCSVGTARRLGVPSDRWVFPLVGLDSSHAVSLLARRRPERWPAMEVLGRATAARIGRPVGECELIEVYSCFPSAVRVQQRALGLDPAGVPTVTGGMAFAGGPFNNFVLQATVAVAERLRGDPSALGMVTTVSGLLTKPGIGVWSAGPDGRQPLVGDLADQVAVATEVVEVVDDDAPTHGGVVSGGRGVITATVTYDGMEPVHTLALCDQPDGRRTRGHERRSDVAGRDRRGPSGWPVSPRGPCRPTSRLEAWPPGRPRLRSAATVKVVPVDAPAALAFARDHRIGVLVTRRQDGSPQLSNILYVVGDDGAIRISMTESRAKTKNLRRDPRATLYVTQEDFWAYVVMDGSVSLSEPARDPDDATVEALVELYRAASGEHPDWDEFRRAMVAEGGCWPPSPPTTPTACSGAERRPDTRLHDPRARHASTFGRGPVPVRGGGRTEAAPHRRRVARVPIPRPPPVHRAGRPLPPPHRVGDGRGPHRRLPWLGCLSLGGVRRSVPISTAIPTSSTTPTSASMWRSIRASPTEPRDRGQGGPLDDRPQMVGQFGQRGAGVEPAGRGHHIGRSSGHPDGLPSGRGLGVDRRSPSRQPDEAHRARLEPAHQPFDPTEAVPVLGRRHLGRGAGGPLDEIGHAHAVADEGIERVAVAGDETGLEGRRPEPVARASITHADIGRVDGGVHSADEEAHSGSDHVGQGPGPHGRKPDLVVVDHERPRHDVEAGTDDHLGQSLGRPSGEEAATDGVLGQRSALVLTGQDLQVEGRADPANTRCTSQRANGSRCRGRCR